MRGHFSPAKVGNVVIWNLMALNEYSTFEILQTSVDDFQPA